MDNKTRYLNLCKEIPRDGIQELVAWLERSDFFQAPASTRFHGNYAGGLCEHSLHVYDQLNRLLQAYPEIKCSNETAIIISLFHDLCKVNFYTLQKRNRKNGAGMWESYDAYTIDEKMPYGGHGSKSVFIVQTFMRLTLEEAISINCHMSSWDGNTSVGKAYEKYPLAWLLHVADEAATYIDEGKASKDCVDEK